MGSGGREGKARGAAKADYSAESKALRSGTRDAQFAGGKRGDRGMRKSAIIVAGAVILAGRPQAAEAQSVETEERPRGEVRIYQENDYFNPFSEGTDRYYTHGQKVEWLPPRRADEDFLPGITHADWCRLVCGKGAGEGNVDAGFAVGQNMYTPADITNPAPQPFDRPWAGLLYASRIARISYKVPSWGLQRQDRIEVSLGIVGPASFAEELQIWWHSVIDADRPNGWDNQLRNEPVLQLRYETALRWPQEDGGNADFIARGRANLGNALTSLEAEGTVRIGWNLSGFGVQAIGQPLRLAAAGKAARPTARRGTRWPASANLFLRGAVRAVARNIVIDGNTFVDNDIRIDRTPFVPEFAAGVEMNVVNDIWLSFQFIHRGSEFEDRLGRAAPAQQFGAFTLAWGIGR